ncbi:MAG: hypothetical protein M3P50_09545, partial [Actinomycetota bacterium]|nr:hypothetical protein [Actinomycetota bacterium]
MGRRGAGIVLGLGWVLAAVLAFVLLRGDAEPKPAADRPRAESPVPERTPTPAATPTPGDTEVQETDGSLAVGITEPNPNFIWAAEDRPLGPPFGPWRDALAAMRPAYYRLVLDWASLQPAPGRRANLDLPNGGCMRRIPPCGTFAGLRDQLRAAASQQKRTGME